MYIIRGVRKYIAKYADEVEAAHAYDAYAIANNIVTPLNFPEKKVAGVAPRGRAASVPAAKRRKKKKKKKKKKSTPAPSAVIVVQSDDEDMEPSSSDEDDDESDRGSDEEIQLLLNSTLRGAWLFGEAETNM